MPLFFLSGVTVNGKTVNIGNGNSAAIDTGTTLIGGPTAAVKAIWSAVPGARALSGQFTGFWAFRTYFLFSLDSAGTHKGAQVLHRGLLISFVLFIQRVPTSLRFRCPLGGPRGLSASTT